MKTSAITRPLAATQEGFHHRGHGEEMQAKTVSQQTRNRNFKSLLPRAEVLFSVVSVRSVVNFSAARRDFPSEESFSPSLLEFEI
jgi:hypothetical protein